MDYKSKYLKYKEKYINLKLKLSNNQTSYNNNVNVKKQIGGAQTTIPSKRPPTFSFLFMPLIYYAIDPSSVTLPDGFMSVFNECIVTFEDMFGADFPIKSFNDGPTSFIGLVKQKLNNNKISTLTDIEARKDGDHHIPGPTQEIVTGYSAKNFDSEPVSIFINCLAENLMNKHAGKHFVYLK